MFLSVKYFFHASKDTIRVEFSGVFTPTPKRLAIVAVLTNQNWLVQVQVFEYVASATNNGAQWVVGHVDGQLGLEGNPFVEAVQQRAPAREVDPVGVDVCRKLGRGYFEGLHHGLFNF